MAVKTLRDGHENATMESYAHLSKILTDIYGLGILRQHIKSFAADFASSALSAMNPMIIAKMSQQGNCYQLQKKLCIDCAFFPIRAVLQAFWERCEVRRGDRQRRASRPFLD